MCFVLFGFHAVPGIPLAVAANREEFFGRPTRGPAVEPGPPAVLCGRDERAGGTWLGVNASGILVLVTNRYDRGVPPQAESRGQLCRGLLDSPDVATARHRCEEMLATERYAGVNVLLASTESAWLASAGAMLTVEPVVPGFHTLTNANLDDPHDRRHQVARKFFELSPRNQVQFLRTAKALCQKAPDAQGGDMIVLRGPDRGTVSSSIVTLAKETALSSYWHAEGAPDRVEYEDYSGLLRGILRNRPEDRLSSTVAKPVD